MKIFTEDEKIIAKNIDKEYKWIARDKCGTLHVYTHKPVKRECAKRWGSSSSTIVRVNALFDQGLFKSIKWEDDEPTLISDIYNPPVLDDIEREYLKTILKPFHGAVKYVEKVTERVFDEGNRSKEYLYIAFYSRGCFTFPDFDSGAMYSGMELNKRYKLNELGIIYTEE